MSREDANRWAVGDIDRLTHQGQQYYADRRQDGVSHEQAMKDALHSYGEQRGPRSNLRRSQRVRRGGWVAPLQPTQFEGLTVAVGPGAPGDAGTGGDAGGDGSM